MSTCGCCPKGFRRFFTGKLGKCPRCMRVAALGTGLGLVLAVGARWLDANAAVVWIALVLAMPFALLLAAHALSFLGAARRAAAAPAVGPVLDRRAFVGAGMVAFCAVLLGAPLPAWAGTNPGNCKYDKKNDKCDPHDCGKIYDGSNTAVTLTCTTLTIGGTKDCYCVTVQADRCKDANGDCDDKLCPDLYESMNKKNKLVKKCLRDDSKNCYCGYTKK